MVDIAERVVVRARGPACASGRCVPCVSLCLWKVLRVPFAARHREMRAGGRTRNADGYEYVPVWHR